MKWTVAVGVDTHKEVHVAVALDPLGVQLDSREIATTAAGYRSLLSGRRSSGCPPSSSRAQAVTARGSFVSLSVPRSASMSVSARAARSGGVARVI